MTVQPICLSPLAASHAGRWVALRNGQVLEARETLAELAFVLHDDGGPQRAARTRGRRSRTRRARLRTAGPLTAPQRAVDSGRFLPDR